MQNFFFATERDEESVWGMALTIPGLRIFERSTDERRELREFTTPEEIISALVNQPTSFGISLFPSTVGASLDIQIDFDENGQERRRSIGGWIPANFARHAPVNGCLCYSNIAAWNGPSPSEIHGFGDIDWKKRASLFRKLKRQVEKAAPAKASGIPILPDAFEKLRSGEIDLWGAGEVVSISSPLIVVKGAD